MKSLPFKTALVSLFAIAILNSCGLNCVHGSGNELKEERKVANFTKINVSGGYNILLKQDSSLTLNITADDNVFKYIRTNVNGDELKIDTKRSICANHPITIIIGIRNLAELDGSGAVEFKSDGKLNVKDIDITLAGAGHLNLDMNANNVITKGSGATEISLKGQATSYSVDLTGTGSVDALDFVVNKYDIQATGTSTCKINVLNELNVNTTGASDIQYRGNPAKINNSKTGSSDIKKID